MGCYDFDIFVSTGDFVMARQGLCFRDIDSVRESTMWPGEDLKSSADQAQLLPCDSAGG